MKKLIISGLAMFMSLTSVMAQEETGIGNHLGWGVGFGTEGFNASIATDLTQYAELEFGVNYAPGFSRKSDGGVFHSPGKQDVENHRVYLNYENGKDVNIGVKTSINRATLDFKGSVYPFATNENFTSDLFVSLGISFASKEIATIEGSCSASGIAQEDLEKPLYVRAGKFMLPIDKKNGELVADGSCQVNSVRPYVGLGYGRLVPKNNLGFRVEAGCQFSGSVKVYHDDKEVEELSKYNIEAKSTAKKFMDFFSIYPVLKVSLRGKFF